MHNIAVFPNVEKEDAPEVLARIFRFFEDKDVRLLMPTDSAAFFHCEKYGVADIDEQPMDMALSIGGDGTLLGNCRRVYKKNVPVCGVNIGTLGFLAKASWKKSCAGTIIWRSAWSFPVSWKAKGRGNGSWATR